MMPSRIQIGIRFIMVACTMLVSFKAGGAQEKTAEESFLELAPYTSSLARVEILEVKDVDNAPYPAPFYGIERADVTKVKFKVVGSTGSVDDSTLVFVRKYLGPFAERPLGDEVITIPKPVVDPHSLEVGKQYYIAFAKDMGYSIDSPELNFNSAKQFNPPGLYKVWPQADANINDLSNRLIQEDTLAWQPVYNQKFDLSFGIVKKKSASSWKVQAKKKHKLVWEREFTGNKTSGALQMFTPEVSPVSINRGLPLIEPICPSYLVVESEIEGKDIKEFPVGDNHYRLKRLLDPKTGVRRVVEVIRQHPASSPAFGPFPVLELQREYSPEGLLRREQRFLQIHGNTQRNLLLELFFDESGDVTEQQLYKLVLTPTTERPDAYSWQEVPSK